MSASTRKYNFEHLPSQALWLAEYTAELRDVHTSIKARVKAMENAVVVPWIDTHTYIQLVDWKNKHWAEDTITMNRIRKARESRSRRWMPRGMRFVEGVLVMSKSFMDAGNPIGDL